MTFKFKGDIENISELQKKFVEVLLHKRGYNNGNVLVKPVGRNGDNYGAHVKRLICEAGDGRTFNMIGKIAPAKESIRAAMNTKVAFRNETIMYNEVFPKMNALQNSAGVRDKIRFPICYGVLTEVPHECILLEDLNCSGFKLFDRFKPMPNDAVRMIIKYLAIYHSLSYAIKNAEPESFKKITSRMFVTSNMSLLLEADDKAAQFFETVADDIKGFLDNKYKRVITATLAELGSLNNEVQSYEKRSKHSVIQQGDCWCNNFLFQIENGKPVQTIIIDYQMSRESNPVSDILYTILNCTDYSTRLDHYREWIDYYHETLDESLANHGLKASVIYPRYQLDADLRRYGKMMVGLCVLISFVTLKESKAVHFTDIDDAGTLDEIVDTMQRSIVIDRDGFSKIKDRIEGIMDTGLEVGLI